MIDCSFLPVFYEHHQCKKAGTTPPDFSDYTAMENIWLSFYGLGKFEIFQFIYAQCNSFTHLQQWMIALKGEENIRQSAAAFEKWAAQRTMQVTIENPTTAILNEDQRHHWRQQGYIKISGLVPEQLCDDVCQVICTHLGADYNNPQTWYNTHAEWHGLMLQLYQHESINAIRALPLIQQVFTELYGTPNLVANTEKVSFNPPETDTWKFSHHKLHWDIDFTKPDRNYIQGLVYLNDVPENRGPFKLVPGFNHQFEDWMKTYPDPIEAQQEMQKKLTGTPVTGKKGDIILWLQTLPHAASANHSNLPRFVQYISFSRW